MVQKFDPKNATDQADAASSGDVTSEQVSPYEGAQFVPMPAGGLRALAGELFPADRDNPDAMKQHVSDLLVLNAATLRNEDSYTVGTQVRIA